MEGVGSLQLQHAVQGLKTALQNSGLEAATKTVEDALRVAEDAAAEDDLAAAAPQRGNGGGGDAPPTPGHGLGQHVDITV